MNPVKTMSGVVTRPVHTAASLTGRAFGLYIGAAKTGLRTTGRMIEWAADRGMAPEADTSVRPDVPLRDTVESAPEADTGVRPEDVPLRDTVESAPAPAAPSVPTPATVKPAIDRAAPLEAESVEPGNADDVEEGELRTASGIPAADVGVNPATGRPNSYDHDDDAPLLDPATVKDVASESEVLRRAADHDKG